MGKFKKWVIGMNIVCMDASVYSNTKNNIKLYTRKKDVLIPIQLDNMDSHKNLIKRNKDFIAFLKSIEC